MVSEKRKQRRETREEREGKKRRGSNDIKISGVNNNKYTPHNKDNAESNIVAMKLSIQSVV